MASYTAGWLPYSTDGRYTADDIVENVAAEITPAEVYYGLGLLEKKSCITDLAIKCATHSGITVGREIRSPAYPRPIPLWDFTLLTSPISRHPKSAYVSQGL
jgi:hypothetical protein